MAMRHHRLNYIVVGFFVIAMMGVAFGSFLLLTGQARETDQYHIVMDNVADVKFGTQVRYEGYSIGQVERISPFSESGRMRFRLDVSVQAGWRVPDNSIARIGSTNILAAKTVDIAAGDSTTALKPGVMIGSAPTRDMFVMMANLADEFGQIGKSSLRPLIDDLAELALRAGGDLEADLSSNFCKRPSFSGSRGRVGLGRCNSSSLAYWMRGWSSGAVAALFRKSHLVLLPVPDVWE